MKAQGLQAQTLERLFCIVLALVCVGLLVAAWGYTAPIAYDPIGPRPYPLLILSLMLVGVLTLALRPKRFADVYELGLTKPIVRNLVLCTLAMLLYGGLFEVLGYVVATTLMSWAIGILFAGKPMKSLIASLAIAVLTYLLFDKALDVSLPRGILAFLGI